MGFLRKLLGGNKGSAAAGGAGGDPDGFHFYVRCDKCGEALHIRVNRTTDIAVDHEPGSTARTLHKEILGSRCQNLMYVHLTLDAGYHVTESETERCTLISREQFEAAAAG